MDLPTRPQTRVLAVTPGKSRGHSVSAGRRVPRSPGSAGPSPAAQTPLHSTLFSCLTRTLRRTALHASGVRAPVTSLHRQAPAARRVSFPHSPHSTKRGVRRSAGDSKACLASQFYFFKAE